MEYLRSLCLPADLHRTQKCIFDLQTEVANINRMIFETNKISRIVVAQLDSLENMVKKYLNSEEILELDERRMKQCREFEPLQFLSLQPEVSVSEMEFARDVEEVERTLKLKSALVNLFFLCFEEIQWTVQNIAIPEMEIMDAWYEAISLFRARVNRRNANLEKIPFVYGLRNMRYEPIIEQKHERHVACLYRVLLAGRDLASSALITKLAEKINREDCHEIREYYEMFVKERKAVSMLRTLCYEEIKGERASEDIKLFRAAHEIEI